MGLNFQTTTIINNNDIFTGSGFGGKEGKLRLKNDFIFEKQYVDKIYKATGHNETLAWAKFKMNEFATKLLATYYSEEEQEKAFADCIAELHITLGEEDAASGAFATSMGSKRTFTVQIIPMYMTKAGFSKIIPNNLFNVGKNLLEVTHNSSESALTDFTLTSTNQYLRFKDFKLDILKDDKIVISFGYDALVSLGVIETNREDVKNAFGTYSYLTKNLRLPTEAASAWTAKHKSEVPVVGGIYNQYIIDYVAPAANEGTMFVGHKGLSHTTHVFWVKNDPELITAWENALKVIDPDGNNTISTGANERMSAEALHAAMQDELNKQ